MAESLYDRDLQDWIAQTIQHLQNREFDRLDIEHLIEELVDLGKSEKNALKSNLTILLAHLLKLRVQADVPDTMKASWYSSVINIGKGFLITSRIILLSKIICQRY